VLQVVLLDEVGVVFSNNILLFLLPLKLLLLKLPYIAYVLALFYEAFVSLSVGFVQVLNILLAFDMGVIINFERPLRSEEVRIGLIVIGLADLVPLKGKSDDIFNLVLLAFVTLCKIFLLVLRS